MDQELWRKAEELFHAALECAPDARQAFLDRACHKNDDLRRQVELLLAKDEEAGSFLERPPLEQTTATFTVAASLIGRQIGPYRIVAPLGVGGMGEVYRAHDSKLGRDVAIKTLPAEFARDPERLARLRREARTLASLNHPNIAAIYGLEESEDTDCLVLELVEGETPRGPLPLAEALRVLEQIAEGLEAAHDKGIIHRDLKPANVKVTPQGRVKVLDFGLAKAIWGFEGNQDLSQLTAVSDLESVDGQVLGTPGYMSPEQARGREVDRRTDIWAFGCLMYELLTGKRAFQGGTVPKTIAAVLEREPDWLALPAKTPERIRELLRQCLQKDAVRRLSNIADARRTIQEAQNGRSRRGPVIATAVALGTLTIAAALIWSVYQQRHSANSAPTITRLTTDSGLTTDPALSADGKLVAYASDRSSNGNLDIWVQQTEGGNPLRLTTNEADDLEPSFSPDGTKIVFRSERDGGSVYIVPALGGVEQRIADLGRNPRFSPDGKWIAYWTGDQSYFGRRHTFIIPATGGEPREIQPAFFFASHPVWSPDSKHLLFRGLRDSKAAESGLVDWWVTPLDGGEAVQTGAGQLLFHSKLAAMERSQLNGRFGVEPGDWVGDSVYFSASSGSAGLSGSLWRAGISSRYHIEAPVQRLTSGTQNEIEPSAAGARIAFASVTQNENIWSLSVDPNTAKVSGEPQRLTSTAAADVLPAPSADGKKVVFASNRTGNLHVWIKDLESGAETALTSTPANELPWLLSADGSHLVYCNFDPTATRPEGCFIGSTDGGAARKFCEDCPASSILDWFDNGRRILYKKGLTADTQFVLRDISSGRETLVLQHPKYNLTAARFSADGRWMSFQKVIEPATRRQILITPIRDGVAADESEWVPITDGLGLDRNAVWSPDGNMLYFLSERDGFRCFWAQRLDRATKRPVGPAFAVYHFHQARRSLMPSQEVARIGFSVTRDKIIFSMAETNGNIWLASLE